MTQLEEQHPVVARRRLGSILVLGVEDALGVEAMRALVTAGARVEIADSSERLANLGSHAAVINLVPVVDEPRGSVAYLLRAPERRRRRRLLASLAEALANAPHVRLVQRSTVSLYADGGDEWVAEDWPLQPNDATVMAKVAEDIAQAQRRRGGSAVVLRFGRALDPVDACAGTFARLARKGWQPFDGRPDAFVPLVRVDDAAVAIVAALDAPSGTFNVAGPALFTNGSLNRRAADLAGKELAPLYPAIRRADRQLLERSWRVDSGAFTRATGWEPRPTFGADPVVP